MKRNGDNTGKNKGYKTNLDEKDPKKGQRSQEQYGPPDIKTGGTKAREISSRNKNTFLKPRANRKSTNLNDVSSRVQSVWSTP